MRLSILALVAALAAPAFAQTPVTGRVVDGTTGEALPVATALAVRLDPDSTRVGVAADAEGRFELLLAPGPWRLRVSFVGYAADVREIAVEAGPLDLGDVGLQPAELGEIEVDALRQRVEVRGDTTAYDAAAYAVNPDASVEDLVSKLPGVTVQDGEVQAQGERVRRVLVDGEEFFGSDPSAALRNLPAEVVQEIQVYERASDQAEFTGVDDGEAELTINVVTRPDRRRGQFGRLFASGGGGTGETAPTEARYSAGGAVHAFQGTRRISVIGLANNVNDQNFSAEDLLGVLDSGGGGRGRGRGGRGGRRGGAGAGTYLVGEQPGVTTTQALGVNYTDRFGDRVRVQGSAFLNRAGTRADAFTTRDYVVGDALSYAEGDDTDRSNSNLRFSGRVEADLSDATQLTVRPRLSVQTYDAASLLTGQTFLDGALTGLTRNGSDAQSTAATGALDVLLRRRFETRGRSLSLGLGAQLDGQGRETDQDVLTLAYGAETDTTSAYQRQIDTGARGRELSASLRYTEPLAERLQLQLDYSPSVAVSSGDSEAFRLDPATGLFTVVDSSFTSVSDQRVVTHRGGADLSYRTERLRLRAGLEAEVEQLTYDQGGPRPFSVDRTTPSLLPSANARYEITDDTDLDLRYRARTQTPSVNQLRDIVDDTNALLVTAGNPDLATAREHTVDLRLRASRPEAGSVLFGSVQLATTADYVGQSVTVAGPRGLVVDGVALAPGAQLTTPVNLDGYTRVRAFGTLGRPISLLKSNANVTLGATYTRTPSLYNDLLNRADALALTGRAFLGTSASTRFDASLSYGVSWTGVQNTSRVSADDTYLRHRGEARLTWLPTGGITVTSTFDLTAYTGLDVGTVPTTAVWNAGLGYKFLADDLAEVRLSVNDLLGQNTGVTQTLADTYVETSQAQALGRTVMLGVSYRLRVFGASGQIPDPDSERGGRGDWRGGRGGDGPRGGGRRGNDSPAEDL